MCARERERESERERKSEMFGGIPKEVNFIVKLVLCIVAIMSKIINSEALERCKPCI